MYICWELFLEGIRSYFKFLKNSTFLTSLTHEFAYVAWGIKEDHGVLKRMITKMLKR